MHFSNYITQYDARHPDIDPRRYYRQEILAAVANRRADAVPRLRAEMNFIESGRSYVKIWPRMLDCLALSDIAIPTQEFERPSTPIEVRLPHGIVGYTYPYSILVYASQRELHLSVAYGKIYDERRPIRSGQYAFSPTAIEISVLLLLPTLDACVRSTIAIACMPTPETELFSVAVWRHVATCVCACLFIQGKHHLVMPDLEPPIVLARRRELAGKQEPTRSGLQLTLGREIELPPSVLKLLDAHRDSSGPGRELTHAHLRRGHLRHQRKGPMESPRIELIYVAPTIVRPDLPMDHGPRYAITDRALQHTSASSLQLTHST